MSPLEENHLEDSEPAASRGSAVLQSAPEPIVIEPARSRLHINFRELWAYRELLYFLIWRDVKVRYKQTVLGAAWAILQPVLTMVVFSIFFGHFGNMPTDGLPKPIFYYSALLPWMYFAAAITNGSNALVDSQNLISKVYFPRLVIPLSATLTPLIDFAIAFTVLAGMMGYYWLFTATPVPLTAALLVLPGFIMMACLTAFAASLWLSALNVRYRDIRYTLGFLVQFWMFASPVAYPTSMIPERWRMLYGLNPMAGVVESFRWAVTGRGLPPGQMTLMSCAVVAVLLLSGLAYFKRMEGTFADVI